MKINPGKSQFYKPYSSERFDKSQWPVLICLLGGFELLKAGRPVILHNAIKTRTLLTSLALEKGYRIAHDTLLNALWPNIDKSLASQSLSSLIHNLRKLLSDQINGEPLIIHSDGYYQLNTIAGVGVDIEWFEDLISAGKQQEHQGNLEEAIDWYEAALNLYKGDLYAETDSQSIVVAESLRAQFLTLLYRLADYYYSNGNYSSCLDYAHRLLTADPCYEDAHRLIMHCYMRLGERSQALRQYRMCESILRKEFDAIPERATTMLYDQIRLDPDRI